MSVAGYGDGPYGSMPYGSFTSSPGGSAAILESQKALRNMKVQFIASENLRIVFPPFLDIANNVFVTVGDVATLIVVKPDETLFSPAPTLVRDLNSDFWSAEISSSLFEIGEWTIKAVSDAADTLNQYQSVVWGDYMTDIRQATLGRWKIVGTQLLLYSDDGITVFRTFDLKDSGGVPSVTNVFEREPV